MTWNNYFLFRIYLPILILLPVNPLGKLLILYLSDVFSKMIVNFFFTTINTESFEYVAYDRLLSVYTEAILCAYLISLGLIPSNTYRYCLLGLCTRMIGIYFYLKYNETLYLKAFPDVTKEYLLVSYIFQDKLRIGGKSRQEIIFLGMYLLRSLFEIYIMPSSFQKVEE